MAQILVVDDDPAILRLLSVLLTSEGMNVRTADNGERALEILRETEPDLVVLDLQMPVMTGDRVFSEARASRYEGPIIICSAYGAGAARKELGADAALEKPFDPDRLIDLVHDLLREARDK